MYIWFAVIFSIVMKSDRNMAIIGIIVSYDCESIYAGSSGDYIKHSEVTYMYPKLWMQYKLTPKFCPVHVKYPRLWSQYVLYLMRTVKNVHVYENWSNKYTDITHMGCIWKKQYIYNNSIYIHIYMIINIGRFSSRSLLFNIYHCTSSYYIIGYLNRVERKCYVQNHI